MSRPIELPLEYLQGVDKMRVKSVIVVGSPRSGTSMTAGILKILGVDMGESDRANNEDYSIVMSKSKIAAVRRRDKEHLWGFKDPSGTQYLNGIIDFCPNPLVICCFRDILAVSQSRRTLVGRDLAESMFNTLSLYGLFFHFLQSNGNLLNNKERTNLVYGLSYERVLRYPEHFLFTLVQLLDIPVDEKTYKAALDFIVPDCGSIDVKQHKTKHEI